VALREAVHSQCLNHHTWILSKLNTAIITKVFNYVHSRFLTSKTKLLTKKKKKKKMDGWMEKSSVTKMFLFYT
jgi:hypothetical protein